MPIVSHVYCVRNVPPAIVYATKSQIRKVDVLCKWTYW